MKDSAEKVQDVDHHENKHSKKHGHRAHFGPHKIGKSPDHFREKIIKEMFGKSNCWLRLYHIVKLFFETYEVNWKNCRPWFVSKRD